jgi:hypothetical protein
MRPFFEAGLEILHDMLDPQEKSGFALAPEPPANVSNFLGFARARFRKKDDARLPEQIRPENRIGPAEKSAKLSVVTAFFTECKLVESAVERDEFVKVSGHPLSFRCVPRHTRRWTAEFLRI